MDLASPWATSTSPGAAVLTRVPTPPPSVSTGLECRSPWPPALKCAWPWSFHHPTSSLSFLICTMESVAFRAPFNHHVGGSFFSWGAGGLHALCQPSGRGTREGMAPPCPSVTTVIWTARAEGAAEAGTPRGPGPAIFTPPPSPDPHGLDAWVLTSHGAQRKVPHPWT